jgi:hypothetical protein
MSKMSLDEWVGKYAFGLGAEISTHLSVCDIHGDDREFLLRMIFTSIRQWHERSTKGVSDE